MACLKTALYVKGNFQYHVTHDISVYAIYVGTIAASSYLSYYADKLLKGGNQSTYFIDENALRKNQYLL